MKKTIYIFLIFLVIAFISCGGNDTQAETEEARRFKQINKILAMPSINTRVPEQIMIGTWKAITLGEAMGADLRTMPSSILFKPDKTYEYKVMIGRQLFEASGKYIIDKSSTPFKIDLYQKYPRNATYVGIIDFVNKKTMKIMFYEAGFLPRPDSFIKKNVQIFLKNGN